MQSNIQWYPGHMTKTKRMIEEVIGQIDVVVEIIDARVPVSSRNPDFETLLKTKPRVVVMNKCDLADASVSRMWEEHFKKQGIGVISANSLSGKGCEKICAAAREAVADKIKRNEERGINKTIKLMMVGIPNVGKSTVINRLSGKASAKTGDKPGVTRGKQWIRLQNGFELLDTPGVLWPKFEDQQVGMHLAFIGSIKDEIIDVELIACKLLEFLRDSYPDELCARYKLENIEDMDGYDLLCYVGKKRGFVISGGEIDTFRGANVILDEFRGGKIGMITVEKPE